MRFAGLSAGLVEGIVVAGAVLLIVMLWFGGKWLIGMWR